MTELRRWRDLAGGRPRWGYRRLELRLWREGWVVNHKLVSRPYQKEGLSPRRNRPPPPREETWAWG